MGAKIYPKFCGRLGNNLFQMAACIGYAQKHGVKWGIKKGYIEDGFKVNQVDKFMPNLPVAVDFFRRYKEHDAGEFCHNYHEIPYNPDGWELVGFFQSEKYFESARDEVRSTFGKYVNWAPAQHYMPFCSIHVRRGDYVQHAGSFPPVTVEYIHAAVKHVMEQNPNCQGFIIFSDDIAWCRTHLNVLRIPKVNLQYYQSTCEWDDFSTMASCGHHIIANSSFSWWAAWLGRNATKTVVCPSADTWYGPESGIKYPVVDMIPEKWHQIKTR